MKKQPRHITRTYTFWTYDVLGNNKDGYEMKDSCKHGDVTIRCKAEVMNAGTEREFITHEPTDRQLSRAISGRGLVWEWREGSYEAETQSGKPIGCLELVQP